MRTCDDCGGLYPDDGHHEDHPEVGVAWGVTFGLLAWLAVLALVLLVVLA